MTPPTPQHDSAEQMINRHLLLIASANSYTQHAADPVAAAEEDWLGELVEAARAALEYDKEIEACRNDPERMASHCTVQGETLDQLYDRWVSMSRIALAKAKGDKL